MLLNWILLEFQNGAQAQAILEEPHWRKTVSLAERTMLKPYYQGGLEFLNRAADRDRRFYQCYLYDMPGS
ncbi:hypothetical protein DEO45_14485 [Rhodanobacter denitrificans]|uniref:Uncharacterized protein n=1 Tax=Rhodanobacter denitrificans TaxID=666685 RepID=A0A368KAC8_9GAMM|nr:hypothetical protein DEO45_14485 [Rhodanobacter denitrificans]